MTLTTLFTEVQTPGSDFLFFYPAHESSQSTVANHWSFRAPLISERYLLGLFVARPQIYSDCNTTSLHCALPLNSSIFWRLRGTRG